MLDTSNSAMKYQYQLNKQLADQNRNWQERMANTAHQREIKDLKAAGLNPVLSVTGGNGATTPSGSTASVSDGAGYFSALANLKVAQLNNATQLQLAQNQHDYKMLEIAAQGSQDRETKSSFDGSSYYGQYRNAKDDLMSKFNVGLDNILYALTDGKYGKHTIPEKYRNDLDSMISDLQKGLPTSSDTRRARQLQRQFRRQQRKEKRSSRY